jgi:DNA repair exonuclease SbcCD ATPase subunit
MKQITLQELTVVNFKGVRKFKAQLGNKEISIFGDNGTGKTSLFDSFIWTLFGKDSTDRNQFGIKTIEKETGKEIPKIDHSVEAKLLINDQKVTLKRVYREKWSKTRGSLEPTFKGHETLYYWNDVPMTARDYAAKINDMVDEEVFKLITSPYAFNALHKDKQRKVLLNISGGINEDELIKSDPEFKALFSKLSDITLEEYEKQLKASIAKSKKELNAIPTRIDEVDFNKPEAIDFDDVRIDIAANKKELKSIQDQIADKSKAQKKLNDERTNTLNKIQKLEEQLSDIKHKAKLKAKEKVNNVTATLEELETKEEKLSSEISDNQKALETLQTKLQNVVDEIKKYNEDNDAIRKQWHQVNTKEFKIDDEELKCPTCKRTYDSDDVEAKKQELEKNFTQEKISQLDSIELKGQANKKIISKNQEMKNKFSENIKKGEKVIADQKEEYQSLLQKIEKEKESIKNQKTLEEIVVEELSNNKEYAKLKKEITSLNNSLSDVKKVDTQELEELKLQHENEIEKLNKKLDDEQLIKKADERIKELSDSEAELAQTIVNLEKDQFVIERFNKSKDTALEDLVNNRFELVKFQLFETQVNGGEIPTCKATIDGVPFADLNTASKINAGIDIINVLSNHYQVSAPVFIDNAESITKFLPTDTQIIKLIVSKKDKKLRIE